MVDQNKNLELEDERTAQKRYTQKVQEGARRPIAFQAPANTIYTQDARPKFGGIPDGQLIGRVALIKPDPMLGGRTDFYIGEKHVSLDGIEVFSWAAPVACTYFRGSKHHDWCDDVAIVRSFVHRDGQITDLADDIMRPDAPARPFLKRGLAIPGRDGAQRPAPTPRKLPGLRSRNPLTAASDDPGSGYRDAPPAPAHSTPEPRESAPPDTRAESLLRSSLAAPRTNALAPVLSTLQPDQYNLVTIPAMDSVIIEGQPGTGKTIVASHRAAWMINDEMTHETPENALDGDVLLVGPTDGYATHVRGVVSRLSGESSRVHVTSMPGLIMRLLGVRTEPKGAASRTWMDVDLKLVHLARLAIHYLRHKKGVTPTVRDAYECLRSNGSGGTRPLTRDQEWTTYLRTLPPYERAITFRAHSPLVAFIRWEVAPLSDLKGIEHIIVDEAQDVNPLEWFLLTSINEASAWTLLGDLNQRRSDHTLSSWRQICEILAVPFEDPEIHRLERGYRSTKPILEFANRLIPRAQRALLAFQQEGPQPAITRVREEEVDHHVLSEIYRFQTAYPLGTVAVIGVDPRSVRIRLRGDGWQAFKGNHQIWEKDGRQVTVVHPDAARGLEFDAVVVVEPSTFPENFGRQGPLYTALTRPNRELSIVHGHPLPDRLKVRKR